MSRLWAWIEIVLFIAASALDIILAIYSLSIVIIGGLTVWWTLLHITMAIVFTAYANIFAIAADDKLRKEYWK